MLTFNDWYTFNFVDNKVMDHLGDMFIKVFRKKSFKTDDKCFEVLMRIDDVVRMFGHYQIIKINYHTVLRSDKDLSDYKVLCALICPPEEEANDQG